MVKILRVVFLLTVAVSLSACAVGKGMKLAVDCKTDEALHVLEQAEHGGGLTGSLAMLEQEAVLRDAGRMNEAEALRAKRESQPGYTEKDKAEAEKAILDTVDNIRNERKKQTNIATCP